MASYGDEVRHPRPPASALVGLVDRPDGGERMLPVGKNGAQRRLVRDERPHVLRMLRHQRERVHRAAAGGEQVDRPAADGLNEPMQVLGVDFWRYPSFGVGLDAALASPRIIGDDRTVREMPGQSAEAGRTHR